MAERMSEERVEELRMMFRDPLPKLSAELFAELDRAREAQKALGAECASRRYEYADVCAVKDEQIATLQDENAALRALVKRMLPMMNCNSVYGQRVEVRAEASRLGVVEE